MDWKQAYENYVEKFNIKGYGRHSPAFRAGFLIAKHIERTKPNYINKPEYKLKDKVLIKPSGFCGYVKKIKHDGTYLIGMDDIVYGYYQADQLEELITYP